jgi:RNA polymerase sigma-70 factor (ECF subfamily)
VPYEDHLSRITTEWDLVFRAHDGTSAEVTAAQTELMLRYAGAVHRFLLGAVRDPHTAADLDQEFALRFLRGDFHRADPSRGRFRDFVKRALRNLMIDHHRRQQARPRTVDAESIDPPSREAEPQADFDRRFLESWQSDLMARAWQSLRAHEEQTGQPFHSVLHLRAENPKMTSQVMAEVLNKKLGREVTPGWVRQNLHLARERFTSILVDEVAASLEMPSLELVEEELATLGLLESCRDVIARRRAERLHP